MNKLDKNVLVLNQNYEPISIVNVKKAILLLFLNKAEMVEELGDKLRSINLEFAFPSVVRIKNYIRRPYREVVLNRKNIHRRDRHICQYCGKNHSPMTVDHVVPKQFGGKDTWENLVCACIKCNNKKGNRTPEQANLYLIRKPTKPSHLFYLQYLITKPQETWRPYLFMN